MLILFLLVIGLSLGWVAQMITGRRDSWLEALVAATLGSFVGGLIASLLVGDGIQLRLSGIIGSLIGAVIVLWVWGMIRPQRRDTA